MKIITLIKKLFGDNNVSDYMEVKEEEDECIEYYAIDENEDDCEPTYFIKSYTDGLYVVTNIMGEELYRGHGADGLKKYMKNLKIKLAQPAN